MGAGHNSYYNPRTNKWTRPKNQWERKRRKNDACYVATAVYGSYDCPEVWTLRRFRDYYLKQNIFGQTFIKLYYAISPIVIRLFGETAWFNSFFKNRLDEMVKYLNKKGYSSEKYEDYH